MLNNMRAERARNNLTIQQVADKIEVHANIVSRWENGKAEPSARNLIALCHLYDCSPEYLLDMTQERKATAIAD